MNPPALAERLVRWTVARTPYGDALLGDLREGFIHAADADHRDAARWYWKRALSLAWHYLPSRLRPTRRATARDGDPAITILMSDLRFAVRTLRRSPSFTIAAILALGLGTGSAASVFSLLNGVVLRPLPYANPSELVMLWDANAAKSLTHERISPITFYYYRGLTSVFQDAAAWWRPQFILADGGPETTRVNGVEVTENLFAVLGVQPMMGRDFPIHVRLFGGDKLVMISHRLWQQRFNGDRAIIGRVIHLNGVNHAVSGVMPPGFSYPGDTDLWQQLSWDPTKQSHASRFMESVARLQPGATIDQAQLEVNEVAFRLAMAFPHSNVDWNTQVVPLDREVAGVFRPGLFTLLGASALLLLIACISVANLMLARSVARRREIAVRSAIGASRSRLTRLFLAEGFVLAAIGAALGLGIAVASVKGLVAWMPIRIPRAETVGVDFTVLIFATCVAVMTAVAFGLIPAVLMSRAELQDALKDGTKATGGRGRRLRSALVAAEVALAVMLLAGAGLLMRSVANLLNVSAGLDPTSTIAADIQLPERPYDEWPRVEQFYENLSKRLSAHADVSSVGASNVLPLQVGWRTLYWVVGLRFRIDELAPTHQFHIVDEGYFSTLRVPVLRGRSFTSRDNATSPGVVMINESLAKGRFGSGNPIGKRIVAPLADVGPLARRVVPGYEAEIIGVLSDVKNLSLRAAAEPTIYFPARQFPSRRMFVVVRGRGDTARLTALVRDETRRLDPSIALGTVQPMDRVLSASVDPTRFVMLSMALFAALALALAAVGIYGILALMVSDRRREIGVRLAVGAAPAAMLRMIVLEGVGLAVLGCLIGVVGAYVLCRALTRFLFDIRVLDPVSFGGAVVVVLCVTVVACVVPGFRAAAEDPVTALKAE